MGTDEPNGNGKRVTDLFIEAVWHRIECRTLPATQKKRQVNLKAALRAAMNAEMPRFILALELLTVSEKSERLNGQASKQRIGAEELRHLTAWRTASDWLRQRQPGEH